MITEVLHAAPELLHITGDGCAAPNNLPRLGVVGHLVNDSGWVEHLILGFREIEGLHPAFVLVQIVSEYNIWTKI
jgi:hypothetical protein